MESDVGTPIQYNPDEFKDTFSNENENNQQEPENNEQYYIPPPQVYAHHPHQIQNEKYDIFSNLDKTGYIIIFVAFLLGFFMGKTMQPVILRPG
tara:strand:+ start:78 stop:359 length:282 start_codon:yes stop_codon:yes gene_type:complete